MPTPIHPSDMDEAWEDQSYQDKGKAMTIAGYCFVIFIALVIAVVIGML